MKLANNRFSKGEELANAISHLVGALLGLFALVVMLHYSIIYGTGWHVAASIVFGLSLFTLYLSSAFNHILPPGKIKDFFFNFDQIAIYILIAGTYTPFTIVALHGTLGWIMFGIEWGLATIGIALKIFKPTEFKNGVNTFYIASYVIMGWLIVIAVPSVIEAMTWAGFWWIVIGGLFYTLGIIFFKMEKVKYSHLVWHLFVLFGSISHFIAVYYYAYKMIV